jgi:hypothetical protein
MKKGLIMAQVPKISIFGRYNQFIFFI